MPFFLVCLKQLLPSGQNNAASGLIVLSMLLSLCFPASAIAQVAAPSNVSALVYSSTAAELFWTPSGAHTVEIVRNGESLGVFDSRSHFQPGLSASQTYRYELRGVSSDGQRSEPVVLSLTTNGFELPVKRIYPQTTVASNITTGIVGAPPAPQSAVQDDANTNVDINPTTNTDSASSDASITGVSANSDAQTPMVSRGCQVYSLSDLQQCFGQAQAHNDISILSDLNCSGSQCCPSGQPLLKLHHVQQLAIWGNGKRLLRSDGHRQCSLLDIENSSSVSVQNWHLDDNIQINGCQVNDNCPRMLHIKRSNTVAFNDVHISHGKGYTVYVQQVNGFKFENGSLINSGVLGMYIGHSDQSSSNVHIRNSVFTDNQTNALALLGVNGTSTESNVVENNVFLRNHRKGQWQVLPRYGSGFTGGGQLYIAQAQHLSVRNNQLFDGYCDNCFVQRTARSGVTGIELSLPGKHSVRNVIIDNNTVVNHDGFGISQNSNSSLDSSVRVQNNQLINNTVGEHVSGAIEANNTISNTNRFESFESSNSLGSSFQSYASCPGASVNRVCDGNGRFGSCYASLSINSEACDNGAVSLSSDRFSANAGQTVYATGWKSGEVGEWCISFEDASGNSLQSRCQSLASADRSTVQSFVGLPALTEQAPAGSAYARVLIRHGQRNAKIGIDDLKWSVR